MKRKILLILSLSFTILSFSQNDILLVTDNDFSINDNSTFYNSILTTSYTSVTLHDSNTNGIPTSAVIDTYDLVIWYTGDDSSNLNFWSNGNTGNTVLRSYLNNGGKLWIVGSDLLFGTYFGAPATFTPGEFMYDYAWLASYDTQTYVDDGGLGVPQIERNTNVSSDYPSPLTWIYTTLYYIDGVTPRPEGISVYEFGPASYPNAGETTMTFYEGNTFSVMSTLFNPTNIDASVTNGITPNNDLDFFIQATLDHIFTSSLSVNEEDNKHIAFNTYPNPSTDYFHITFNTDSLLNKEFKIYSILGKLVLKGKLSDFNTKVSTKNLPSGTYFLKVEDLSKKIIKY
ncbi:T9SS type A sorting domain-containing protein [Lacinutrix cladophorae]